MNWFRDSKPVPQGDGADTAYEPELQTKTTRIEPYPQLNSVQQDEAIALLKGVVAGLEKRVRALEKK